MRKIKWIYYVHLAIIACITAKAQNYTTPFTPQNLLPEAIYDLILGESSGEQAYYHVLELAPYEKNRNPEEYQGDLHETKYVYNKLKAYGLPNVEVERIGKTKTWDGVRASLWEKFPKRSKIIDYEDLAASLAQGSASADVEASLVWVGRGTPQEIEQAGVKGKIIVTESAGARVQSDAEKAGAAGIISFYSPRPLIDPLQIPNASIRPSASFFCFNLPPRDGYVLRDRLLAGESIVVKAEIETTEIETDNQITTCLIPGIDADAGEIIVVAHLFEGYVKLGANDNNSGAAAILDMARTLNQLIRSERIPRPKRSIRFLWVPEISGTSVWLGEHKDIITKTLCGINLDMVGLWLSKSDGLYCLQRTTMGNPHYVNDVAESFFHYIGATNKSFLATGAGRPEPIKPVFSLTGSHEPFYYAISAHYGSSDHEVFNDFGVNIPTPMFITWPDNYYHTSGDRPSILDPTQLRRAVVIATSTAYIIASADVNDALKIAAEVAANAIKRLALSQQNAANSMNNAQKNDLQTVYKRAIFNLDAYLINEIATLESVLELAPSNPVLKKYIDMQIAHLRDINKINVKGLDDLARACSELLHADIKPITLMSEEQKAAKIYPVATSQALEKGYGALRTIPREIFVKHGIMYPYAGRNTTQTLNGIRITYGAEIVRLTATGKNSILDIKKMLDAQFPDAETLADISTYLQVLKDAQFVTY